MKIDLRRFSHELASTRGLEMMEPAIEKEIVHYDILRSLSDQGLLNRLTFQGGTCLRLCYGSQRYSEDLDFTAGDAFDDLDLDGFTGVLERDLLKTYDVAVRVKKPKTIQDSTGVGMRRWTVVVNTDIEREDIPSQRIKIEIASVPSYTSSIRTVRVNYPELETAYGATLIRCQKLEEIMADKLISFSATDGYIRHRDLWDIPWLGSMAGFDIEVVPELVASKHADYGFEVPLERMLALGVARAKRELPATDFQNQMKRFIPSDVYGRTVGRADYREHMLEQITEAYRFVAQRLGIQDAVDDACEQVVLEDYEMPKGGKRI